MKHAEIAELPFELMVMEWSRPCPVRAEKKEAAVKKEDRSDKKPPPTKAGGTSDSAPPPENQKVTAAAPNPPSGVSLSDIRGKWNEILGKIQERNVGLLYMLGAAELVSCQDRVLTLGSCYPIYRDRMNEVKYRQLIEETIAETVGVKPAVKVILVAKPVDAGEPCPTIAVKTEAKVPDGFADLVKEFGGTVVP